MSRITANGVPQWSTTHSINFAMECTFSVVILPISSTHRRGAATAAKVTSVPGSQVPSTCNTYPPPAPSAATTTAHAPDGLRQGRRERNRPTNQWPKEAATIPSDVASLGRFRHLAADRAGGPSRPRPSGQKRSSHGQEQLDGGRRWSRPFHIERTPSERTEPEAAPASTRPAGASRCVGGAMGPHHSQRTLPGHWPTPNDSLLADIRPPARGRRVGESAGPGGSRSREPFFYIELIVVENRLDFAG